MSTVLTIGLVIIGIIVLIGIIRVIITPYTGFIDLLIDILLLDYLADIIGWVFESIGDIWDD